MELRHLRYFVAVAEEMNIHRAAARLHISQPPLSLAIQQLEEEIGAPLFTREGRGIQITRAGKAFLSRAREILAASKDAAEEARNMGSGVKGLLRVGFVGSCVTGILQNTIASFKKKYPDVALHLAQSTTSDLQQQISDGEFDVGIIRWPDRTISGVKVEVITKESWMAAMPPKHRLAAQKDVSIKDLEHERLIFYPRYNSPYGYDDVMEMFREKNIVPNLYQEATEQMLIAGLVASGMGVGIVPECMAGIRIPNVVHRPLRGTKDRTGFAFVHRGEDDALVKNFVKEAKAL